MAEPTFFESLMKTLKVGEKPKTSTTEYTVPDSIPLIGGKKFTLSNEFSEETEKFFEDARASNERDRKRREEEARKSLVKEVVDAAKPPKEIPKEVPLPKPPPPPIVGQVPSKPIKESEPDTKTGTGGTEGSVETQPKGETIEIVNEMIGSKGGTVVPNKVLDSNALRKRRSLVSRIAKRGLLAGEDTNKMLN